MKTFDDNESDFLVAYRYQQRVYIPKDNIARIFQLHPSEVGYYCLGCGVLVGECICHQCNNMDQ